MKPPPGLVDVDEAEVRGALERIAPKIEKADLDLLEKVLATFVIVNRLLRAKNASLARLRRLFGFGSTEKTEAIIGSKDDFNDAATALDSPAEPPMSPAKSEPKQKAPGHGRLGVTDYPDAEHIAVPHQELSAGDKCTDCLGTLHAFGSSPQLRIFGQPSLVAKCWDCERLRCSRCGYVYTAKPPLEAQGPKYDETAVSTIIHLRFGAGLPHNRLERLQGHQKTPVPASTQWELMDSAAPAFLPIFNLLKEKSAQGTVIHSDDTHAKILEYMGQRRALKLKNGELEHPERTGLFTTAVVSKTSEGPICLFFTGPKHAGENLANLLVARAADLEAPVLMSDALSRNVPVGKDVDEANCLSHARRNFIDELENHRRQCEHVIEELRKVFQIEKESKAMTERERFEQHKNRSGPIMKDLQKWMENQLESKSVEPNSGLGKAFKYMLKRWRKFTLFTRKPGVPLENNIAERALKAHIRHRRNSIFFKTQHGADIGDIFTSLIHTVELHEGNPWEYLTAVQRNAKLARTAPEDWLPWTYQATLSKLGNQRS